MTFRLLAVTGLFLAFSACSSSGDEETKASSSTSQERVGQVGLNLQPVSGLTLNTVHYVVTAGDPSASPAPSIVAEGNLPTPGSSADFSFGMPLPVGTGYHLALTAESAETGDDITCTGHYGPFAVLPNTSTQLSLVLTCVDNTTGQPLVTVDVATDACPRLIVDHAVAEPASALIGSNIALRSHAHDLDGTAVTYSWSIVDAAQAGVGQFLPASSAETTFACFGHGQNVRIRVTAANQECQKSLETVVTCFDATCGNGVVEPALGETCDTALDATCPLDCNRVCGDGVAELGEECDPLPATPSVCIPSGEPGQCTLRQPICGDGFVTGPEICDPLAPNPLNLPCDECTGTGDPICGDGVAAGLEECDGGTGSNAAPLSSTTRTCSAHCETISNLSCVQCEQAGDCFASSDNCVGPSAAPFTLQQQLTCTSVMRCIQNSNCLDGAGSLGKCYCGTLGTAACGAAPFDLSAPGAPNGPCAALIQQGNPGVTSNSGILGGLTNKSRPAGAAGQRLNCQKNDPACTTICGLTAISQHTCGDGVVELSLGETCEPALDPTCPADCSRVCGDGIVESGEECDVVPADPAVCVPAGEFRECHVPHQECPVSGCPTGCLECEQEGDCSAAVDNCFGPNGAFSSQQTTQCFDVMQCVQESNCADGNTTSLARCYCGTLSTAQCAVAPYDLTQAGAPNGPCAAGIQQGMPGLTTNTALLGNFTGKARPAGAALQRLNCQKVDPLCAPLCGF